MAYDQFLANARAEIDRLNNQLAAAQEELATAKLGEAAETDAANRYAQQVAHWIEKHDALKEELSSVKAENVKLRKGEFICKRCGLRKDSEHDAKPDF